MKTGADMEKFYLTGMMGCGKSAIGKRLSQKLKIPFVDLDALIERREGKKITEIFAQGGDQMFRDIETETLKEVAGRNQQIVVSCGGGIILRDENVCVMKETGSVILIHRDIDSIAKSIQLGKRPVLKNDAKNVRHIYEQRKDRYEAVSDLKIDNNGSIEETVKRLAQMLKPL